MANRKWKMEKAWQFAIYHLPFPIRPGFFSGLLGSEFRRFEGRAAPPCVRLVLLAGDPSDRSAASRSRNGSGTLEPVNL
jgi:hypothetical protein